MATDLSTLQIESTSEGAELPIMHPVTRASTGITFKVVRRHSRPGKNIALDCFRENTKGDEESDVEYLERIGELTTCDLVIGWDTDEEDNCIPYGEDRLEYSKENVRRILLDPGFYWMLDQVQGKVLSLDTFFGKTTTN